MLLDEEEDNDRYSFWFTQLGVTQGDAVAKSRFEVSRSQRDYSVRTTGFISNRAFLDAWRKADLGGAPVRKGVALRWHQKTFEVPSAQSYQSVRARLYADNYLGWDAGLEGAHYIFISGRDENKLGGSLSRSFGRGAFDWSVGGHTEYHWARDRLRLKKEAQTSAVWRPDRPYWERSAFSVAAGQRDTKADDEDRDDNLDYSFWEASWDNNHPVLPGHAFLWALNTKEKDDKGGLFSWRGYKAEARWRWRPERAMRGLGGLKFEPFVSYKFKNFQEREKLNFRKVVTGAFLEGILKSGWRLDAETRVEFYDFYVQQNRREIPVVSLNLARPVAENMEAAFGATLREGLFSLAAKLNVQI